MSKRELSRLIGTADVEGSRLKRRRDAAPLPEPSPEIDVTMSGPEEPSSWPNGSSSFASEHILKEQGLQLLQTIKEAKAKDGRQLALAFLTKPPRKIYPDYYQLIHKPIALDDIKRRIDNNAYLSLQAIRVDFELLFNNALQYNMKDSVIWKDARDMLKLMQQTYERFILPVEADEGSDDDEKKGKSKGPSLNRLIKSRLQKLIEKTDKDGRVMSTEFMELPNKKQWAIYYKQIKQPRCFEGIFRKIKRKEYHSSAAFASDVELVFSNAMSFNQDHTIIWEDASALRDYFKQLMSDLPPPFNLPGYSNNKAIITNKIRIKPPIPPSAAQTDFTVPKPEPSSSTLLLRVPAVSTTAVKPPQSTSAPAQSKVKPTPAPVAPSAIANTSAATAPAKVPVAPQPQRPAQHPIVPVIQATKSTSATPQPTATAQQTSFTYSHYYQQIPPPTHAPSTTPAAPVVKTAPATSNSPVPVPVHPSHQIKFVKVRIQPQGRLFWLDHREGVKTWAMRLAPGETGLHVDDLIFAGDEDVEESSDEEEEEEFKQEEEEEDMDIDGSGSSPKTGRMRKGRPAVRRSQRTAATIVRTTRSSVAKNKVQEKKKEVEKVEEVLLKLNGIAVKEMEDTTRQWNVSLPVGSNILEVGEKGGLMWKVYVERMAD